MATSPKIGEPVDIYRIYDISRSTAFGNLVARAQAEGLSVRWETAKDRDGANLIENSPNNEAMYAHLALPVWSRKWQLEQLWGATPRTVRIVSGEFNIDSWNQVSLSVWRLMMNDIAAKGKKSAFAGFSMYGMCSPYLAVGVEAGNYIANKIGDFFFDQGEVTGSNGWRPVRLFSSEQRLPCHWVAIGNRISITDWHEPMCGPSHDRDKYSTTVYAEGPGVARFAEEAFEEAVDNARYDAEMYQKNFIDHHDDTTPERYRPMRDDIGRGLTPPRVKKLAALKGVETPDGFLPAGDGYYYAGRAAIQDSYKSEIESSSTVRRLAYSS